MDDGGAVLLIDLLLNHGEHTLYIPGTAVNRASEKPTAQLVYTLAREVMRLKDKSPRSTSSSRAGFASTNTPR